MVSKLECPYSNVLRLKLSSKTFYISIWHFLSPFPLLEFLLSATTSLGFDSWKKFSFFRVSCSIINVDMPKTSHWDLLGFLLHLPSPHLVFYIAIHNITILVPVACPLRMQTTSFTDFSPNGCLPYYSTSFSPKQLSCLKALLLFQKT